MATIDERKGAAVVVTFCALFNNFGNLFLFCLKFLKLIFNRVLKSQMQFLRFLKMVFVMVLISFKFVLSWR